MSSRLVLILVFCLLVFSPVTAKEYSLGTQEESVMVDARAVEAPAPEIPAEYKDEAFKSTVLARFNIAADGKVKVEMLGSSGNEDIDKIVLTTLKKWRFQPATVDGAAVNSARKLRIELEVE